MTSVDQQLTRDEAIAEIQALGFSEFHSMINGWLPIATFGVNHYDARRFRLRTVAGESRIEEVRDTLAWCPLR